MSALRVLVVGLGSPDRGDDAVGATVAHAMEQWHGADVTVVAQEDPTNLVTLWDGFDAAIVVDAVMSGGTPGAIHVVHAGVGSQPLPTDAFAAAGRGGSHAFGLAGAVELARTLGTLPATVAIVGVEAQSFEHGPMTEAVAGSIGDAIGAVYAELDQVESRAASCA